MREPPWINLREKCSCLVSVYRSIAPLGAAPSTSANPSDRYGRVPGVHIAGGTEAPSFFASLSGRVVFFLSLAAASAISVAVCQFIAFRH